MKHLLYIIIATAALLAGTEAFAQRLTGSNYATVGYVKSDGTIQDSSYRTIGHIKSDGTVQDGSYRTIGHASGVKKEWAAFCFFFF